jgi:hypothetical protein
MGNVFITEFDQDLNKSIRRAKTIPVLINYTYNGRRYNKKPDTTDHELINQIEREDLKYWYPINRDDSWEGITSQ